MMVIYLIAIFISILNLFYSIKNKNILSIGGWISTLILLLVYIYSMKG